MERGKRVETDNGDIPLPEPAIQHIQSFLSEKQAARTCILSKSWYNAWLTRPNLDFDIHYFGTEYPKFPESEIAFLEFAKKTMERHERLKLKIKNFRLCMSHLGRDTLVNKLIVQAVQMGVEDLNLEFRSPEPTYVIANEVLGAETLIRLSASGCTIDRPVDGKVSCTRLKSLGFRKVYLGNHVVWDVLLRCPLIEKLLLSECKCFVGAKEQIRKVSKIWTWSPLIESVEQNSGLGVCVPHETLEFRKLKCLFLEKATLELWFFNDFSLNFPCLEDLTLHNCGGCRNVRISSDSLKYISFAQPGKVRGNFDVPSICKFSFSGSNSIPSVSFGAALGEWECNISIRCHDLPRLRAIWFYRLKGFLTTLRPTKISLSLQFSFVRCIAYVTEIEGSKPVVENLMVSMDEQSAESPVILSGLFCSCRPKVLTPNWCPRANYNFLKLLCEKLIRRISQDPYFLILNRYGPHDLEELNVEVFEETFAEWRPLPLKILLDALTHPNILLDTSTHPAKMKKLRFHFNWLSLDQH